jgi:hypothetical protein
VADRYLLESSSVDGYQLEDGSGVLSLENSAGGGVIKDDARILRWSQEGDFAVAAAPAAYVDDESGGWFGSITHRLATLATVAAATLVQGSLAAAAIHQQTEDVVPAAPPSYNDWVAPVPAWAAPINWLPPDDQQIVPQAVATIVVDDDWQPPTPPQEPPRILPSFDQDTWTPWIAVEDDSWQPPTFVPVLPTLRIWTHDDFPPTTPAGFAVEEDGPSFSMVSPSINGIIWVLQDEVVPVSSGGGVLKEPATILRWSQGDDVVTAPTFVPDDDHGWSQPVVVPQVVIAQQPVDDDFIAPKSFEDDAWTAPQAIQLAISALVCVDDDFVAPAAATLAAEDDTWTAPQAAAQPAVQQPYCDQDEITQWIGFDEEPWQPPTPLPPDPVIRIWVDGDPTVDQPVPLPFDEEPAGPLGLPLYQPWPAPILPPGYPHAQDQDDPAGSLVFVEPPVEPPTIGGGKSKKYKRKRVTVEIDGQLFTVASEADAAELLSALRAAATEKAAAEAKQVVQKRRIASRRGQKPLRLDPVEITAPTVKSADTSYAAELQSALDSIYAEAARDAELALHMAYQRQLDEEDALILLLLNDA